jgi:hypothetical protein
LYYLNAPPSLLYFINASVLCLNAQERPLCSNATDESSIQKVATVLEQGLFKSASNFGAYCDISTLETRLRVVLKALKSQQQQSRKQRMNGMMKTRRRKSLQQRLGLEQYNRMNFFVATITCEKTELVGSSCSKCKLQKPKGAAQLMIDGSFGTHLPGPVRDLFLNTPLVDVFQKYSLQRLDGVNWKGLLAQAEANIHAYNAWKSEHYVCYR